jgi:hypothetical protein
MESEVVKSDAVKSLTDAAALRAVGRVVKEWFEADGWEALQVVVPLTLKVGEKKSEMPAWLIDSSASKTEAAKAARAALDVVLRGDNKDARRWVEVAIKEEGEPKGHVVDPVTLIAVTGMVFMGIILAARVKKVGEKGVEFYEGVPKEVVEIVKAVPKPMLKE